MRGFLAGTNYDVEATPTLGGCTIFFRFQVNATLPLQANYIVTDDFALQPQISVVATGGSGNYVYSFDGLPFQNSSEFLVNHAGGDILVRVRDVNGCYELSKILTIWQYPRFFTPNDDGYNDSWGIKTQKNISINIFDRYGKLVKQLKINERWDGTYNGIPLPSTDYWFEVSYENNKTYKGHFALKR